MMTRWMTAGGSTSVEMSLVTGWDTFAPMSHRSDVVHGAETPLRRRRVSLVTKTSDRQNTTSHSTVKGVVDRVERGKKRRRTIKRKIKYERTNGRAWTKTHIAVHDGSYYVNWTDGDVKRFIKRNVRRLTLMANNKSHTRQGRDTMKIRKMAGEHWMAAGPQQWRRAVIKNKILYASFLVGKWRCTAAVRRTSRTRPWRKVTAALNDWNHKHLCGRQHTTVQMVCVCIPFRTVLLILISNVYIIYAFFDFKFNHI